MDAFSIIYPQFWLVEVSEKDLQTHVSVIKKFFGQPKEIESSLGNWEWTREIISPTALDKQLECFKISMASNSLHAMRAIDPHIHPLTKLWHNLSLSPMLPTVFPQYFKLAELAMIMVLIPSQICIILNILYMIVFIHVIKVFRKYVCK